QDVDKTFHYTVTEVASDSSQGGYTYDKSEFDVAVAVSIDPADAAKLVATQTITRTKDTEGKGVAAGDASVDAIAFHNAYDAAGEAELAVRKSFGAHAWPAGRTFDFELLSRDDRSPLPKRTSITGVGQDDSEQSFGTIAYTLADLTKTTEDGARCDDFVYVVREVVPDDAAGITYDTTDHVVTVHVEDAGDGTLATSYDFGDDGAWATHNDVATLTITNGRAVAYHFENVDERDNERLGGAKLTLVGKFIRLDGTVYDGEILVMHDGKSYETIDGFLIPGETYTLVDTLTPPGYAYFDPVTVMVNEDGELVVTEGGGVVSTDGHTLTVAEKPTTLAVEKTDLEGEAIATSEAQFSVTPVGKAVFAGVDDPSQPITASASELAEALSCHLVVSKLRDADGKLATTLPSGASVYELRETEAPRGYQGQPDPIYFVLDEYGTVHLVTRTAAGYRIDDAGYASIAQRTGDTSLSVADPANLLRLEKLAADTKQELSGVTYRIEGEFADDSTSVVLTDEDGESMSLDRMLVNGNTYTILEVKAPARYKRDKQARAFSLDGVGTIAFDGDAGGYTVERVYDESLGQWVSVIRQEDEPVEMKHPTPAIEPVFDPSLVPEDKPGTDPAQGDDDGTSDDKGEDGDDTHASAGDSANRTDGDGQTSTRQQVVSQSTSAPVAGATTTTTVRSATQQKELATTADATDGRMGVAIAAVGAGAIAMGVWCQRPRRRKERR
ncbi:MAG: hypothetical protein J6S63_03825, partial [Atopobiaceae bacterium]|nr:hypothetical protein [Atopobiaceae bacterium]